MASPTIPRSIEAEVALLGCIFLDESLMTGVLDQIDAEDFYDSKNKEIYKAMTSLYLDKQNIDITTINDFLTKNDKLNVAGGMEYIESILVSTYTTASIDTYIKLIKDASVRRKYINKLNTLVQEGYNPTSSISDYIENVEREVFELSKNKRTTELIPIRNVFEQVRENVALNAMHAGDITGLDTGFNNLNKITLGLQKDALIILAARPAMGKSAFAMNLAVNIAKKNKLGKAVVAVFSLEMAADQLVERMVSSEAMIESYKIKKGSFEGSEVQRFANAGDSLSKYNIYFDDSSDISVEDIRTKCRKLASEVGIDAVVIDYLQLIKGDQSKSKNEEVGNISRSLKLMARELHIPVIALSQLSRKVEEREDKKPMMSDLRDSGSIEQDADIVMFLYRDDYYKKENSNRPGEADLIIGKNRSGSTGELPYRFEGKYSRFVELDKKAKGKEEEV